jgi:hemoglobin/transferrin/lactoferrin receptor protein
MIRFRSYLLASASAASVALIAPTDLSAQSPPTQSTVLSPIVVKTPRDDAPSPQRPAQQATPSVGPTKVPAGIVVTPTTPPPPPPPVVSQFDALSTGAGRSAGTVYDAPATVTVKSAAEIERQLITTPRDLVRDEPGVSVANQATRGGGTNYTIRGIGENRVRLEIDGVKVPDFPGTNIGAPTGYTRDFVDLDALKRVEIVRGPASALYGSDAIGGVVAYTTKDPVDYLDLVRKNWYASVKGGFDTSDRSVFTTLTGANRIGAFDTMILVTRKWGHEITPNGPRAANPQDFNSTNVLSKLVWNGPNQSKLAVTGEYYTKSLGTNLLSEQSASVLASRGDDDTTRRRLSLDWTSPVSFWMADAVKVKLYGTDLDRTEHSDQRRLSAGQQRERVSDFGFQQGILGGDLQFSAIRSAFGAKHEFIYGTTVDLTSTARPRDRYETNLVTGITTTTVAGEKYPNKNFPDTTTTQAAVYAQDTAQWGAFRLIPAVRLDYFSLKVHPDAQFANSNTGGFTINDQSAVAVSPKLGATYDLNDQLRLFGQYARGFRAPPYDNANFGFRNPVFGYEILPNGNLSPETSNGFEAGLRGRSLAGSSFQVSAFYNKYKDFIDTVTVGTSGSGLTQFQYQNISNVTIHGYEAKGEYKFMPEWALFGSLAYAKGTNDVTGAPLDSVDPWTGITGIRYRGLNGWGGELRAKYVAEKDRVSLATVYKVPAHTTVDALASYEIAPLMTINAGVFNVFNQSYFNPADVAGFAATNTNLDLFRASGRTVATNLTLRW